MLKPFRAVLISEASPSSETTLMAGSDFDAFLQAKQALGDQSHFDLWDGQRRALTYKPVQRRCSTSGLKAEGG